MTQASQGVLPKLEPRLKFVRTDAGEGSLLAFAELVIAGCFIIKDIRVMRAKSGPKPGPFVAFPSRKGTGDMKDKYFDIAHPITSEAYAAACEAILAAYRRAASSGPVRT